MLNIYDKFTLSRSNANISVAYNGYCNLVLITSLMKQGPEGFKLIFEGYEWNALLFLLKPVR